jgi:hypothetical protein
MGMSDPELAVVGVDIEEGRWLVLEDDSRWGIAPDEPLEATEWRPGTKVTVSRSGDAAYPWALTKVDGGVVVRAKDLDA